MVFQGGRGGGVCGGVISTLSELPPVVAMLQQCYRDCFQGRCNAVAVAVVQL